MPQIMLTFRFLKDLHVDLTKALGVGVGEEDRDYSPCFIYE